MKLKSALLIVLSGFVIFGCGKKDKSNNAANPGVTGQSSDKVATFKYYKGGFMPAPNQPNWSNDMTITFTTSGFYVEGKSPDALCTRGGPFTQEQTDELFKLVSALQVATKAAGGPVTADAGVEYIEITSSAGVVRKYHLMNEEVPVGELYAVNPTSLHNYLQSLEAGLPTACQ